MFEEGLRRTKAIGLTDVLASSAEMTGYTHQELESLRKVVIPSLSLCPVEEKRESTTVVS